jgi:hypothetical protein
LSGQIALSAEGMTRAQWDEMSVKSGEVVEVLATEVPTYVPMPSPTSSFENSPTLFRQESFSLSESNIITEVSVDSVNELRTAISNCQNSTKIILPTSGLWNVDDPTLFAGSEIYKYQDYLTGVLNGFPVVNCNLEIDGRGTTLKRTSVTNYRFFSVRGVSLKLKNMILDGGKVIDIGGGALFADFGSHLKLDKVVVKNSQVIYYAPTGYSWKKVIGGGVYAYNSSLTISRSTITNNSINATYPSFDINQGGYGGGVGSLSSNVEITYSDITNNTASHNGKGAWLASNIRFVNNSCIFGNTGTVGAYGNQIRAELWAASQDANASYNWWGSPTPSVDNVFPYSIINNIFLNEIPPDNTCTKRPLNIPFECAYSPMPANTRGDDTTTDVNESKFADSVNLRFKPVSGSNNTVITVLWGIKIQNTASGYIPQVDYNNAGNVSSIPGVEFLTVGSTKYQTNNRRMTPLYQHLDANNSLWYLVDYNGSLVWIGNLVIDITHCGEDIEDLPIINTNNSLYDLNVHFSNLPVSNGGLYGLAPDPGDYVPVGECISGLALNTSWKRCAYDFYRKIYYSPQFRNIDGSSRLTMADVLGFVLFGELGGSGLVIDNYENLTLYQQYFIEALARNFAQVCGQTLNYQFSIGINCNIKGMIAMLEQVQSFYQTYNLENTNFMDVDRISLSRDGNGNKYTDYSRAYAQLIFNHPEWYQGISVNGRAPMQWGNWKSSNSNGLYNNANNYIFGIVALPNGVVTDGEKWVYVLDKNGTLLVNNSSFAIQIYNDGESCQYAFAITVSTHNLGQTESC